MPRALLASSCLVAVFAAAALAAAGAHAQDAPAPAPTAEPAEGDALAALRDLEARLSLGETATERDTALARDSLAKSPHARARALAAAVFAWLEPDVAAPPLIGALADPEARVRATAAQSLLSLGRRYDDEQRRRVVSAGLAALDDSSDEVACAAAELVGALSPSAAADALRSRAPAATDARYACFARTAGLPLRAVELPPLPAPAAEGPSPEAPPQLAPVPPEPPDGTWLLVGAAASAGLVAGALVPGGFVPARDVLFYDDDRSRIAHEEVAIGTQLATGALGALALGGGAWALSSTLPPLAIDEAGLVAVAAASLGLAGASSQLAFGLREGPTALAIAGGLGAGLAGGAALAWGGHLTVDDGALAAAAMTLGALGGGLLVFTATPVALTQVGGALRVDFGLGVAGMTTGLAGFGALVTGAFVDVAPRRSFAVAAGGVLLGGAAAAVAFALVPEGEVKSRIACGVGLAGQAVGMTLGILAPDAWLPSGASAGAPAAVSIDARGARLGVPTVRLLTSPGRASSTVIEGTLLTASF